MGEIARPGVYESKSPYPLIIDIVRRAGGLNNRASGNVRVVRRDRVCQQIFLSASSPLTLLPGDLLVVDSPSRRGRLFQPVSHRPNSQPDANSGPSRYVQLAFVQLLDRPVVLKMRREQATLAQIVSLLNQPVAALRSVRLIGVPGVRSTAELTSRRNGLLPDGCVLVFDSDSVNRKALPELPGVIRVVALEESGQTTEDVDPPVSDELGRVRISTPNPLIAPPIEDVASPNSADDLFVNRGRRARESQAASDQSLGADINSQQTKTNNRAAIPTPAATTPKLTRLKKGTVGTSSKTSTTVRNDDLNEAGTVTGVVFVIGGLGVAGAFLILLSMARSTPKPKSSPTPTPKTQRDMLDALIRNELPLSEESLPLPDSMTMFGRPKSTRHWRVDAAQVSVPDRSNGPRPDAGQVATASATRPGGTGGPHFRVHGTSRPTQSARKPRRPEYATTTTDISETTLSGSQPPSDPSDERRLLDRVLAVIEQERGA
jgi:hypothetical protein